MIIRTDMGNLPLLFFRRRRAPDTRGTDHADSPTAPATIARILSSGDLLLI